MRGLGGNVRCDLMSVALNKQIPGGPFSIPITYEGSAIRIHRSYSPTASVRLNPALPFRNDNDFCSVHGSVRDQLISDDAN